MFQREPFHAPAFLLGLGASPMNGFKGLTVKTSLEQATSSAAMSHVLTINRKLAHASSSFTMRFRSHCRGAREIKNTEGSQVKVHVENVGDSDRRAQLLRSLYRVYQEAKDAFEKLPPKSTDATQNARFLRDTAENFISYIQPIETQNKSGCFPLSAENQSLLLELRETLEHTSHFVERHCGGRKRVWEQTGAQTDLLNHTRQDPDIDRKNTYASDGSARRYTKRSQNSTQLLLHNSGNIPDAAHPRQQQPSASSRSARRRHPRKRAPKVEGSPSRVNTQFIPIRSHQGQGNRLVAHDLYRPADPYGRTTLQNEE